jgi:uncharacterized protein YdeI (YjbR/CyaY-like superfamily)
MRDDAPHVHVETAAAWRAWLEANHAVEDGAWMVTWRTPTGRPQVTWDEAVDEALCFGWIDATRRTVDDERSEQWFCRRRKGSGWSRVNKARIERLEADGRMAEAGRAVIEAAKADGSWALYDEVEDLVVPDDLAAALEAAAARDAWDVLAPSIRKQALVQLVTAKRAETRAKRVALIAGRMAAGERPV